MITFPKINLPIIGAVSVGTIGVIALTAYLMSRRKKSITLRL